MLARDLAAGCFTTDFTRAKLKRKRDFEKHGGIRRELSREREFSREARGNEDGPQMKSKIRLIPPPGSDGHRHRTERPSPDRLRSWDDDLDAPPHPSLSYISGTNGTSNGIIPMVRVFNDTAPYVDQGGGRRKGTRICIFTFLFS
ncbi:hypothetical protein L1987_40828 [Smallanthus sonchifolius]|uniref:Uncharacterized protein n=1 Tax=Smallanthus sonchifolius TaxID=185202 RepID=A0ACB9GUR8_9ASTR|nr:hypothetical protein L1987_40828 [Smallanthus sonchifolius]